MSKGDNCCAASGWYGEECDCETIVSESPSMPCYGAWVLVADTLPAYNKKVLVVADGSRFCAILQNVTRSIAKDAPNDDRWYALPGWGHELKDVTAWCE